jgi:F-type H+-transporting ATPase subunit delta
MGSTRVASRYAKSLIELAKEKNHLEQVSADMELLVKIAGENPQFAKVMNNPIIGHDKKQSILNALFKGRVDDLTFSLFSIITRKNRETHLVEIGKEFIHQYRLLQGIELAEITTTFPLTDSLREDFRRLIAKTEKRKVALQEKIDKNIIGGYILKIGDRQVDESIKAKLQKLKSKFKDNPYISKL